MDLGRPPSISLSFPEDWVYISEGGATLVLSYRGAFREDLNGMVLRLRKERLDLTEVTDLISADLDSHDADHSGRPTKNATDQELLEVVAFQEEIIGKYISPKLLSHFRIVSVDSTWLGKLSESIELCRPLKRRQIDRISCHQSKAILTTDLVGCHNLVIEIKPKWGFLPNTQYLTPTRSTIKKRSCRFCMHSYFRASNGDDIVTKEYCPLDLYSGDHMRVAKALGALWDAWIGSGGGINNLKIFMHGRLIDPNDNNDFDALSKVISLPLSMTGLRDTFIMLITRVLINEHEFLLEKLSNLQRSFDPLDIEGLSKLWHSMKGDGIPLGSDIPNPTLEHWSQFTSKYPLTKLNALADASGNGESKLYDYCLAQLLSGTFKDCSIMIRPNNDFDDAIVHLIDLEPKNVNKLAIWEELDRTLVDFFQHQSCSRVCVDSNYF